MHRIPRPRYAQTEEQRILGTAINRLRPNLRVVVQFHLQGRSMRETAEALGISLTAAKGRLFHARKALRSPVGGRRRIAFESYRVSFGAF
jgi:DNA-directed RNA polymerase specialized sigma24 family protein